MLPDVRTMDGHCPVLFLDHDHPWQVRAVARSLPELYARKVLDDRLEGTLPLDPASLVGFGEDLADGWRAAVGLPPRTTPLQRRTRVWQEVVEGAALGSHETLEAFGPAYTSRFILADRVDAAALPELLRPLQWWNDQGWPDLDDALRNLMARLATLAHRSAREDSDAYRTRELLAGAELLDGLLQTGQVALRPHETPEDVVRSACGAALEVLTGERSHWGPLPEDDGERCLDAVPEMASFHQGWEGIVSPGVLAQGDVVALRRAQDLLQQVSTMKNTVYSLVRRCGDEHLEALDAVVDQQLPADQVLLLHGLDAFPKHPGVLALYDRVLRDSPHEFVTKSVTRYRDRVARGVRTSGWET